MYQYCARLDEDSGIQIQIAYVKYRRAASDKYVIADTIEAYQDYNGDMPEGCPVMFRSFFSKAAEGEICDEEYADAI